jgi:hypothetical protein
MNNDEVDFAGAVRRLLQAEGYAVHGGGPADEPQLAGRFWFTWRQPGMTDAEVGPACESECTAWTTALAHRLDNSRIEPGLVRSSQPTAAMEPFQAARLPENAFDAAAIARKFGVPHDIAAAQVEQLRRQSVYLNDLYQVNAQTLEAPFGQFVGDVIWLSIKRRDKAPVHDWRDLQAIKNLIVGPEHEGFEIYPAESGLVDTANQYHVFVFVDPKVRLPVGFRTREVTGADQAASVGARQRDFHSAV